jgi:hypothetical protein
VGGLSPRQAKIYTDQIPVLERMFNGIEEPVTHDDMVAEAEKFHLKPPIGSK